MNENWKNRIYGLFTRWKVIHFILIHRYYIDMQNEEK